VELTQYHPSIRRLQEDFAARVAKRADAISSDKSAERDDLENQGGMLRKSDSIAAWLEIAREANNRSKALERKLIVSIAEHASEKR
jgi:hypothetical protein